LKDFLIRIKAKAAAYYRSTDVLLLVFLLLFMNIKVPVKLAALVMIYIARFNFDFGISLKRTGEGRLPLFYLFIVVFSFIQLIFIREFNPNYLILFSVTVSIWLACFLALHQVKLAIERNGTAKVENAVTAFLVINIAFSFYNLLGLIIETKSTNPYTFEGLSYKYFTSTGDYIRGVTADVCTTNMIISAFGLFYFLYKGRHILSALCFVVVLLTTSNLGNMILLVFFIYAFLIRRNTLQKSILMVYISAFVIFMVKVSPANLHYFTGSVKKISQKGKSPTGVVARKAGPDRDSLLRAYIEMNLKRSSIDSGTKTTVEHATFEEVRRKINVVETPVYEDDTAFAKTSIFTQERMHEFSFRVYGDTLKSSDVPVIKHYRKYPGKLLSVIETGQFLGSSAKNLIIGAGPGRFSSKMAFRALGLNTNGAWLPGREYAAEEFKENHMKLWLYYQIQPPAEHSVINFPNSVLNQLGGEYGMIGILIFLAFYLWFFARYYPLLTYGKILLPMLVAFLCTDYWFENLSIVVLFELLMYLDMGRSSQEA
jgi:hypothetical protein